MQTITHIYLSLQPQIISTIRAKFVDAQKENNARKILASVLNILCITEKN